MPDNELLRTGGTGGFAGDADDLPRPEGGLWLSGVPSESGEGGDAGREADGKFRKGYSGNPAGRPPGSGKFRAGSRAAAALLDARAEALAAKAIEMGFADDPVMVRFCLGRVLGVRRGQPVELEGALALPEIARPSDLLAAVNRIAAAALQGAITPDEALALSRMVDSFNRALERGWVERLRLWRGRLWRMQSGPKSARTAFGLKWVPPKSPFAPRARPLAPPPDRHRDE